MQGLQAEDLAREIEHASCTHCISYNRWFGEGGYHLSQTPCFFKLILATKWNKEYCKVMFVAQAQGEKNLLNQQGL